MENVMGEIGILNVGTGDTKLVFDPKNPEDMARAAKTITDMLRRGYCILIEVGKDAKGELLYRRVREFDETSFEYVIAGDPPDLTERAEDEQQSRAPAPRKESRSRGKARGQVAGRRISAPAAKGVAIAPIAGG